MTRTQAEALATLATRLRPDWDHPGVMAAIRAAAPLGSPAAVSVALCRLADRHDLQTPALLPQPGSHWAGTPVAERRPPTMCGEHPERRALACPDCAQTHTATDETREEHLAAMRDAIRVKSAERRALRGRA